jgi:predicted glycoside hydrolase/deacetylase ChbG (UPF0249 family)
MQNKTPQNFLFSKNSERSLKIAVDDYGLHPNIDKAIRTLAEQGIVNKVSIMANTAYEPEPLPDHIETGLHIDLTTPRSLGGKPLASSPFQLLRSHQLSIHEIEDRIEAQLSHLTSLGFKTTHIDTHQHIHLISPILQAILNIATTHNIPNIRCPQLQIRHYPFYIRSLLQCGFFKQAIKLQALYAGGYTIKSKLAHLSSSPNLILMPLAHHGNYTKLLNLFVHHFHTQHVELVTHPGLPADIPNEPYIKGREIEYQALLALTDHQSK